MWNFIQSLDYASWEVAEICGIKSDCRNAFCVPESSAAPFVASATYAALRPRLHRAAWANYNATSAALQARLRRGKAAKKSADAKAEKLKAERKKVADAALREARAEAVRRDALKKLGGNEAASKASGAVEL